MNDTYTINDQYTVQLADSKYIHDGVCGHNSLDTKIVLLSILGQGPREMHSSISDAFFLVKIK